MLPTNTQQQSDCCLDTYYPESGSQWEQSKASAQTSTSLMATPVTPSIPAKLLAHHCVPISQNTLKQINLASQSIYQHLATQSQASGGVMMSLDFHTSPVSNPKLIEINTNAGGAWIVASHFFGPNLANQLAATWLNSFQGELQRQTGGGPLKRLAIVDDDPEHQPLKADMKIAQQLLERQGISVILVDPKALVLAEDGRLLSPDGQSVDLVYNRLTDFELTESPHLLKAWRQKQVAITPNPNDHRDFAHKQQLIKLWSDHKLESPEESFLLPTYSATDMALDWSDRKAWFFKPLDGFGSKGVYDGRKITKSTWQNIDRTQFIVQARAEPQRCAPLDHKFDIRAIVYRGKVQMVFARSYRGQVTNVQTEGGGLACLKVDA